MDQKTFEGASVTFFKLPISVFWTLGDGFLYMHETWYCGGTFIWGLYLFFSWNGNELKYETITVQIKKEGILSYCYRGTMTRSGNFEDHGCFDREGLDPGN